MLILKRTTERTRRVEPNAAPAQETTGCSNSILIRPERHCLVTKCPEDKSRGSPIGKRFRFFESFCFHLIKDIKCTQHIVTRCPSCLHPTYEPIRSIANYCIWVARLGWGLTFSWKTELAFSLKLLRVRADVKVLCLTTEAVMEMTQLDFALGTAIVVPFECCTMSGASDAKGAQPRIRPPTRPICTGKMKCGRHPALAAAAAMNAC